METSNITRGTLQITLTQLTQYIIYGTFYIVVAKTGALTPSDLGVLSILSLLASTVSLVTGLALPTAMTRYMAENIQRNKPETAAAVQKTVVTTVLIFSAIGFTILAYFSETLSQYFWNTTIYAPLILLMCIYAFLSGLTALYSSSLQALGLFGKMAAATLLYVVISRTIAALLALIDFGISGVLIGFMIGYAVAMTFAIISSRHKLPSPNSYAPLRPLIRFSFPLIVAAVISLVLNWADIAIIASLTHNYGIVGIYSIVLNSIGMLVIIWGPVTSTIFPLLSARHGLQEFEKISNTIETASRYLAYLMIPSCLGLATIAPTALKFFYGENYVTGAIPLAILSFAAIIISFSQIFATTLTAMGKTMHLLKINIISAASDIVLLLTLIPLFEAIGAASSRFMVQVLGLLLMTYALRKNVKLRLDKEAMLKSITASIATIPFLLLIEHTLTSFPTALTLALEIIGGGCIYLSGLYVLKALRQQDFELLKRAFPKLARYITIPEKILLR